MRCLVVAVVFALGSACAAPVPKDFKKPDDKTLIVGTWVLTRANLNGQENAEYFWHSMTFDADGNTRFRYKTIPDQENEFKLDTAASPKMLTWLKKSVVSGNPRPYAFRDGRLVMAVGEGDRKPVQSLEPGPGVIVLEYERADAK